MLKTKRPKIKKIESGVAQSPRKEPLGFTMNSEVILAAQSAKSEAVSKKAKSKAGKSLGTKGVIGGDVQEASYPGVGNDVHNKAASALKDSKVKDSKRFATREDFVKYDPKDHEFLKAWREVPKPSEELVEMVRTRVHL